VNDAAMMLDLSRRPATDAGLADLRQFARRLEDLDLANTVVTDVDLVHLVGLTGLRSLYLTRTAVTDGGLVHLAGLTGLRALDLGSTKVTDTGLVHLAGLTELKLLSLSGTKVTDAGLVHVSRHPASQVHLRGCGVAGCRVVSRSPVTWLRV
jgi:hypothetical protein